jgi:D-3-phosphoglycerate dehydrogenase
VAQDGNQDTIKLTSLEALQQIIKKMKVLVATEKPFAKVAVDGIRNVVEGAGYEMALLEKYTDVNELYAAVADADALIVRSDKVTKEVIDHAKNLKIVVRAGAGFDNLDLEACTARGIVAMNTPGQNSNAVAELVMGMLVYAVRNFYNGKSGSELMGKKLGILAFGNVGRNVARIAQGFGMDVYAFDAFCPKEAIEAAGVKAVDSRDALFETCDIVSLHIPATEQTKNSIGYNLLSRMPKGGCLVNTARKEVINEEELIKVLREREDLKYITDVATANHAAIAEEFGKRVYGTPKKMGAETAEANVNAGLAAANQICDYFATGNTRFQLNK